MKRLLVFMASAVALVGLAATSYAVPPRGDAKITVNGKTVTVDYGRPSLNGRSVNDLLGKLPDGAYWRLGADKSTTFTTTGDLKFGDVTLPKGEYSAWVQKAGEGYKLAFNSQHGQWGVKSGEEANLDPAKNVAVVPLKAEKESKPAEMVTITLESEHGGGEISIQWGEMELSATFK